MNLKNVEWCWMVWRKFNDLSSIIRTTNLYSTKLNDDSTKLNDAEAVWPRTKAPDATSSNIAEYIFVVRYCQRGGQTNSTSPWIQHHSTLLTSIELINVYCTCMCSPLLHLRPNKSNIAIRTWGQKNCWTMLAQKLDGNQIHFNIRHNHPTSFNRVAKHV